MTVLPENTRDVGSLDFLIGLHDEGYKLIFKINMNLLPDFFDVNLIDELSNKNIDFKSHLFRIYPTKSILIIGLKRQKDYDRLNDLVELYYSEYLLKNT